MPLRARRLYTQDEALRRTSLRPLAGRAFSRATGPGRTPQVGGSAWVHLSTRWQLAARSIVRRVTDAGHRHHPVKVWGLPAPTWVRTEPAGRNPSASRSASGSASRYCQRPGTVSPGIVSVPRIVSVPGVSVPVFDGPKTIEDNGLSPDLPRTGGGKECQMRVPGPFPSSVLRPPSPTARCTCEHWLHCDCACHGRHCDPSENMCDIAFLPDEGGLARSGCPDCTPGSGAPHYLGCELIGWHVTLERAPGLER